MRSWLAAALFLVGINGVVAAAGNPHPVSGRLLADVEAATPGDAFRLGVALRMEPGWHTYWRYSGDAGLPTRVQWKLPPGYSAGSLQWPAPEKFTESGDLTVYGYTDEVLLFSEIAVPAVADTTVLVEARVSWLVCREICIPGSAELSLSLPVRAGPSEPTNRAIFTTFSGRVPRQLGTADGLAVSHQVERNAAGVQVDLAVGGNHGGVATPVEFLPLDIEGVEFASYRQDGRLRLQLKPFEDQELRLLSGVLQYRIGGGETENIYLSLDLEQPSTQAGFPATVGSLSLGTYLLLAIVGGFILNLMPCVLPVISLKVLGILSHAGNDRRQIRTLGFAFVAGIELTFVGLAVVVLGLKLAGEQIGWGFQFQYPEFVLFMSALIFVLGLSLFGLFTLNLSASSGLAASREGLLGSFFNGVLATVLATPCTAPFLGTALGFAFSQSGPVVVLLFAAIGAGMAAPYLLFALKPDWMRWIPRPGPWMERFKQSMGFLLMGTVVWLLWVLGNQLGLEGVIWTISFLLVLGLACWMVGSWIDLGTSRSKRRMVWVLSVVLVAAAYGALLHPLLETERQWAGTEGRRSQSLDWQPYSATTLDRLRAEERTVFVDFTAEWCWTCKINERVVLEDPEVRRRFEELQVALVKADWTRRNPEITRMLRSFGRSGVPLYVVYPGGGGRPPIVLPELITRSIVLEALEKAVGGAI